MQKTLILRLYLLLFCFVCFVSKGKGYYERFSVKNGLSSNIIHSLYEDSKGIVWIGTGFGLNKFDGQNFRVFMDDNSGNSILGNPIASICETKDGLMWFGTDKAICSLNRKNGKWKRYQVIPNIDVICLRVMILQDQLLVFTFNMGVHLFDPKTEKFSQVEKGYIKHIISLNGRTCLYHDNGIIIKLDIVKENTIRKTTIELPKQIKNKVKGLFCRNSSQFEVVAGNYIYYYSLDATPKLLRTVRVPFGTIHSVLNKNTIVLNTANTDLRIVDTLGYQLIEMPKVDGQTPIIYSLVNSAKDLWIGSDNGLFRIRKSLNSVDFINHERGLNYGYVRSILNYDDKRLILGTKNGFLTVIQNFNSVLNNEEPVTTIHKYTNAGEELSANYILKLKTGDVIIGTNKGLFSFKLDLIGDINKIETESQRLNNASIWTLLNDNKYIWIGSMEEGLFRYNKITGEVTQYGPESSELKDVHSLHKKGDRLYLGTSKGLWAVDLDNSDLTFERLKSVPDYCHVWKILNYNENSLIFITTNCGLYKYNINTGIHRNITIDDTIGLSGNTLCGIIPNGNESFYISSRNGLNILSRDFSKNTIINFSKGWADNNYNFNATETFKQNWLLFGTATGLVIINKERIYNKPEIAPYIGGFKIFDKTEYIELNSGDTVSLSSEENFFSFEFSLIDQVPFGKQFSYMLEGVDKSWRTTTENIASYTGLNPGKYRFLLKSENPLISTEKDDAVFVHVIIVPEFYQTVLFKIAVVICALAILIFMVYAQLKKNSFKARMTEVESKLLRLQMNPHFMFNCLTSIQHYIMREDKRKAMKYLAKFSRLIRIMLNNSKRDFIPLTEELGFLTTYLELEGLRMDDFDYSIELNKGISETISIPSMILQPFIENAIKHGLLNKKGKKRIIISFNRLNATTLQCEIIDNGIGIVRARELKSKTDTGHDSFGLELTKNRLNIFKTMKKKNYDFEIFDSKDGSRFDSGTTIVLTMEVL